MLHWAFDSLLGLSLLWLAWRALTSPDLFKAIVLFISFGLLMSLAWIRLGAPDVALAEAAIGAGLTGALLLAALARLESIGQPGRQKDSIGETGAHDR
ncbi:Na(+)/H(+) antiporter subunit B [Neptunomonas sp.]|uniref:Na(+)/H(+) antiporter subunit B n=1 Tax=Neptunomonas sp. TaxID=1971898 RepID=UPI00356AB7DE